MAKKLTYFDLNGIAESIRYILHYTGQKFEDVRIQLKDWPIQEIKDSKYLCNTSVFLTYLYIQVPKQTYFFGMYLPNSYAGKREE